MAFLVLLGFLCIGLLTPVVCFIAGMAVLLELPQMQAVTPVAIAVLSALAYAFLGPGAYSVDARLFGRRVLMSTDSMPPPD